MEGGREKEVEGDPSSSLNIHRVAVREGGKCVVRPSSGGEVQ